MEMVSPFLWWWVVEVLGGLSFDGCGLDFQWRWLVVAIFLGNFGGDKLGFVARFDGGWWLVVAEFWKRRENIIFYIIWRRSLYYFNELYIKIETEMLDEL